MKSWGACNPLLHMKKGNHATIYIILFLRKQVPPRELMYLMEVQNHPTDCNFMTSCKSVLLSNLICTQQCYGSGLIKCVLQPTLRKMYQQIIMHPQDRNLQRILWRQSPEQPIQEYQLTTVTYGTSAAPFLATRCLKKLADDNQDNCSRGPQVLSKDF